MKQCKTASLQRYRKFFVLALVLSALLMACDKAENQNIPPLLDGSKAYFELLKSGDKKKLSEVFFMPLYQKDIKRLVARFDKEHKAVVSGALKFDVKETHQKGRWGLIILNKSEEGKMQQEPLWFFYYQNQWRVISPAIYHTKELRAMMNLYPQHEKLKKWLPVKKQAINVNMVNK